VSFVLTEPRAPEVPVIVEVPHAGLELDAEVLSTLVAPAQAVGRDADLYVDELYADAPDAGATLISARMSRYVCDLNRSEHDVDRETVQGATGRPSPHGLIWRSTTDNRAAIARPLPKAELDRLYQTHPKTQEMIRRFWEDAILTLIDRFTALQRDSAEQRYLDLLTKPPYIQKIPQKYLASFIGVTPTSLSRIRKNIR